MPRPDIYGYMPPLFSPETTPSIFDLTLKMRLNAKRTRDNEVIGYFGGGVPLIFLDRKKVVYASS
jgi:hypothetical protein